MTQKEFRGALLDQLFTFLWRQWSALGVLGTVGVEEEWVIDPEALLVFSLVAGRYEPRLFDEVLNWLAANGKWVDVSRLKNIVCSMGKSAPLVTGAALKSVHTHTKERKWNSMIPYCRNLWKEQMEFSIHEPFFKLKSGVSHPAVSGELADTDFRAFELNRPRVQLRPGKIKDAPINTRTNLRFFLRSLFGVGGKSECLAYLLTHDGGRPRDMAQEIGLFWLGVQNTLSDLAKSGLVLTRSRGEKRVEYWLPQKRWWEFLTASVPDVLPRWVNWISVFRALVRLLDAVDELHDDEGREDVNAPAYFKIQDSLELIAREFAFAGYDFAPLSFMSMPEELRKLEILKFLAKIFGVEGARHAVVPTGGVG